MCPGGEIGRRNGLKIRFPATGVRVQFPPRAPLILLIIKYITEFFWILARVYLIENNWLYLDTENPGHQD